MVTADLIADGLLQNSKRLTVSFTNSPFQKASDRTFRLIPIAAEHIDWRWNDIRPVPLDEILIGATLFVLAEKPAIRAHRAALGDFHSGLMPWRILCLSHAVPF
jgi:hypothetical protein